MYWFETTSTARLCQPPFGGRKRSIFAAIRLALVSGKSQRVTRAAGVERAPPGKPGGGEAPGTSRGQAAGGDDMVRVIGGVRYQSKESLASPLRESVLNGRDPVRELNLSDDSVFYRTTEGSRVKNGKLTGNPKPMAKIIHHEVVEKNPSYESLKHYYPNCPPYSAPMMYATSLNQPTLNVMFGAAAELGARTYARNDPNKVLVSMTLGDLRKAGGGKVFFDASSVVMDPDSRALVVTLPKGKEVPVTVV